MQIYNKYRWSLLLITFSLLAASCSKLVAIDEPINSITTKQVFSTDAQANSAMAGIYSKMISGSDGFTSSAHNNFSNGLTTLLGGLSSDELTYFLTTDATYVPYHKNRLLQNSGPSASIWSSAYSCIYGVNAIIEGIAASSSESLRDSVRKELTGEAKFIRAFCYFYLTNFFGDVPLALTIDFNKTALLPKTPQTRVYQQIVQDLKDAQALLPADYSVAAGERIRPNKWAATAMLARTYLYTREYADAAAQATAVINNITDYGLMTNLNEVFGKNNRESIWQLQQNTSVSNQGTATPEGIVMIPNPRSTGVAAFQLSTELLNTFETGDKRKAEWVSSSNNILNGPGGVAYFPFKYKTGTYNYTPGGTPTEYYTMLRVAEVYLIRAEAAANGAAGGTAAAIKDLNAVRKRTGLLDLPATLTTAQVIAAVAHERQIELFAEWGHRWMDLKRTGRASALLSQMSLKKPWQGDYQLLYPIPINEIKADPYLEQNPGYN